MWIFTAAAMALVLAITVVIWAAPKSGMEAEAEEIVVYKSPTCGCCSKWIDHLRDAGFKVTSRDRRDMSAVKSSVGVNPELSSCHTAVVDGYVVEGHVPAADIKRLLRERPAIVGLTAPGMPMGSPGMGGSRKDAYEVLSFDADGRTEVFAKH